MFSNYDPIKSFLVEKLKFNPLSFAMFIFVADLVIDLFLGYYFKVFYSTSKVPGLLQDTTALATDFVANPIIAYVYLWVDYGAGEIFAVLQKQGVFLKERIFLNQIDHSKKIYKSKALFITSLCLAILLTINQVAAYNFWVPWKTLAGYLYLNPTLSFFRIPFWFITLYGLIFTFLNVGITYYILQVIFKKPQELKLILYHPDKCAGFGSIGKFLSFSGLVMAPLSFWVSVTVISESKYSNIINIYPVLLVIFVYVIFAPILFLWPISSAHNAMKNAKEKMLYEVTKKINNLKDEVLSSQMFEKNKWDNIEIYQKIFTLYSELPEWPFNLLNLQRFFAIIGSSLIPALGSFFINFISSSIFPFITTFIK